MAFETGIALAAGSYGAKQHALAEAIAFDPRAKFMNDADGFVADGKACSHRIFFFDDVDVGAADGGEAYSDYGVVQTGAGDGFGFKAKLAFAAEYVGLHGRNGDRRFGNRFCKQIHRGDSA